LHGTHIATDGHQQFFFYFHTQNYQSREEAYAHTEPDRHADALTKVITRQRKYMLRLSSGAGLNLIYKFVFMY